MSKTTDDFKRAFQAGDSAGMWNAMEEAMANDTRRLEAEVARREAQVSSFQAETAPVSRLKVIALEAKRGGRLYVTKVSYKDGPGYCVSKVAYGPDKAKAQEFSTMAATAISEYLIRCGYTPHLDAK